MSTELAPSERAQIVAARLTEVRTEISDRFLEMGELLLEAFNGNFHRTLGYESFDDFVKDRTKISVRQARYLMDIFDVLVTQLDVPKQAIAEVGWSKVKEILPVANQQNVNQWIEYAGTHTTDETNLAVRQAQAPPEQRAELRSYSRMTFLLFEDEKEAIEGAIRLAQQEAGTDRIGRALFLICEQYAAEAAARQAEALRCD